MPTFKQAFAAAEDGSVFEWNGKKYLKEYEKPSPKAEPKQPSRPVRGPTGAQRRGSGAETPEAPRRPSMADILGSSRRAEAQDKANERASVRSAADSARSGLRSVQDTARQLPGRAVERGLRAAGAPSHASIFAGTLLGNRDKITEEDLDDATKAQLRNAARKATSSGRRGDIQYEDYDAPLKRGSLAEEQSAMQTVGRTRRGGATREGDGYRVTDRYDFSNEGRDENADRYAKMGKGERALAVAKETWEDLKKRGLKEAAKRVPSRLGNAYIGRDSREVDVKLKRGGDVKKYAKGGRIDGCATKGRTKGRFV